MKIPRAGSEVIAWFEEVLAAHPEVAARPMFGQPAGFVNGNLCFGVFGEELFLRLSETDRDGARRIAGTKPFEPMPGRAMSGYVVFPANLRGEGAEFGKWVQRSIQYVGSLPAKAGARTNRRIAGRSKR